MKGKQSSKIKLLAERIAKAEKEIQLGNNVKINQEEIYNIMSHLSIEEMLAVDRYLYNMLKK